MIVKNESHIITETLAHLHNIFNFDYWVISDTGSTDNTKELITNFFKEKNVAGELVENEWKWFGPSRTDALNAAYNKTDYLLIFDADDRIEGNIVLPDYLTKDSYRFKFGVGINYYRPLLINNRKKWKFIGIIHEYLSCLDKNDTFDNIEGNYYIDSRRLGNFNLDPLKYHNQAVILEKEYAKELTTDPALASRYAFYCASSYNDANEKDNAIIWFKKVADELNSWEQEKYCSCIKLGHIYKDKKDFDNSLFYYLKSIDFDNQRIEGISYAIELLKEKKLNILAISLYEKYKTYNRNINISHSLFVDVGIYEHMLMEFNTSVIAYYTKNNAKIGYECCKSIINNKNFKSYTYNTSVFNLSCKHFKDELSKDNLDEIYKLFESISLYIKHIKSNNLSDNINNATDLWNFMYDLVPEKRYSSLIFEVKDIIHTNNVDFENIINKMRKYVFETKEHHLTLLMFNKYKLIALNSTNKSYYNRMCHLVNISSSYTDDKKSGYDCCKYLITNKINFDFNNVLSNMQFYIKEIENDTIENKNLLLETLYILKNELSIEDPDLSATIWKYSKEYISKYSDKLNKIINKEYKVESAKNSKKILIYTGFSNVKWNYTYALKCALGGSEKAVAFMTKELPKDYEIYISGDVEEEQFDNITYINRFNLSKILETTEFHTIIISRYVSFFLIYPQFKCFNLILMAHDSFGFLNNIKDNSVNSCDIVHMYLNIIDNVVALTDWHKNNILKYNKGLHYIIKVINNGINIDNLSMELEHTNCKVKNSFIYTSCSYRGLSRILELWPEILSTKPDAKLYISSYELFPKTDEDHKMNEIIQKYNDSITHLGFLNEAELNKLRKTIEFWFYPTNFCETSCITALEMLASEIICIYYPLAGLNDTLGDYGIKVNTGEEISTIVSISNLSDDEKNKIKLKGKHYALSCSWTNRAKEWNKLINLNNDKTKMWIFYLSSRFNYIPINEYIDNIINMSNEYKFIVIKDDINLLKLYKPDKITFIFDSINDYNNTIYDLDSNIKLSILNIEPLNINFNMNRIKKIYNKYKTFDYYDYSNSNIEILKQHNIIFNSMEYIPYIPNSYEIDKLTTLKKETVIEYDFGILKTANDDMTDRRQLIIDKLKSFNYSINIISGWGLDRDKELAKCKIILNIHGSLENITSNIFEHLRCDRLLHTNYNILSENSYLLDNNFKNKFPNLQLIDYEDFFNKNIIVESYNNCYKSLNHNTNVYKLQSNVQTQFNIPNDHINFLKHIRDDLQWNPDIIYDIGSNVLHWTFNAENIWDKSNIYLFDAMTELKLIYDEHNKNTNKNYKYYIGLLCDSDYKKIEFYQNDEFSGGNSYYKEVGNSQSSTIFTENHKVTKIGMTLESVCKYKNFPTPDLIKIDVQGAELDILKGSINFINNVKMLIVELQHVQYNEGAPLCTITRDFLIENGWIVYSEKFSNNGPDADWCFINTRFIDSFPLFKKYITT